ncbi:MAG: phage major capsid protein [Mycobacterium sp.]|uniref:phage major capsid protein n=1 Tax=Mycobacterium sp. TaxID=1785 RepID=UPI003F956BDB
MDDLHDLRDRADAARQRIIARAEARGGPDERLTDAEDREFRRLTDTIKSLEVRMENAYLAERRAALHSAADKLFTAATADTTKGNGMTNDPRLEYLKESATYTEHNQTGPERRSFFKDLMAVSLPGRDVSGEAAARLARHQEEMRDAGVEVRTDLNTTSGDGGSFVPPAYLLDQYITYARPSRPVANIVAQEALPSTMQVNIPKILTGTAVAPQATQNTAVTETDLTDGYVTSNVVTIAGQQTASRQLIDQSPVAVDAIIFRDLTAAFAAETDRQVLNTTGSGNTLTGILQTSSIGAYTASTNAIASVYGALGQATAYIWKNRFLGPDAIVVSPARWGSWITQLDSTNRPLFLPTANGPLNAAGLLRNVDAQGIVGEVLGVPVVVDAQISDQTALVGRFSDAVLFESGPRAQISFEPLANQLSVLLSVWGYAAFGVRYAQSFVAITLTETPTYGS